MISDNLLKVVEAQGKQVARLSAGTIQMLLNFWRPFNRWTDYDMLMAYSARTATILGSGMANSIRGQRAYMRMVARELKIDMPSEQELNNSGLSILLDGNVSISPRHINPLDQWQRPAEQYRWNISQGEPVTVSLERALERVATMADTDMLLARREEMRNIFENIKQVTGYRRIIHPELSRSGTCGLCVVASQRKYKTKNLLPIHDSCNCDVLPITEDLDPGNLLNDDDLQKLYDAAGSNKAEDLLKTKVGYTTHGELGPILVNGNRSKKALADGQAARAREVAALSTLESLQEQIHNLTKSSESLKRRAALGEDTTRPMQWQLDRISVLQQQLKTLNSKGIQ